MSVKTMQWIERIGIVPVLRARSTKEGRALVEALIAGGITVIEVTMTVPGAVELIRELKRAYDDQVLLGAGTVTDVGQVQETIAAGAEFIVSPSFHPEVVSRTKELGKVSIPGALTPTEVITAWRAGGDYVKVFPCSAVGGARYLTALLAPFPELRLIPTGGVTLDTAAAFLNAGALALGVGADLVNPRAIDKGEPESVTTTARQYLRIVTQSRRSAS